VAPAHLRTCRPVRASFGQNVSWIYLLDGLNLVAGILPELLRLCLVCSSSHSRPLLSPL
jgi:hypothetical protein